MLRVQVIPKRKVEYFVYKILTKPPGAENWDGPWRTKKKADERVESLSKLSNTLSYPGQKVTFVSGKVVTTYFAPRTKRQRRTA